MKIPLGNFGNAIAQPRPRVNYVDAAFDNGAEGMTQFGREATQVVQKVQDEVDKTRVDEAIVKARQLDTELRVDMAKLEGNAVLNRPDGMSLADEYGKKLTAGLSKITENMSERQKAAFGRVGSELSADLYSISNAHMLKQYRAVRDETRAAKISTATNRAHLLWADDKVRSQSLADISGTIDDMAAEQQWAPEVKQAKLAEAVSPLHVGVIHALISNDLADKAQEYYDANSASMSLQARAQVQDKIADAGSTKVAETSADTIWEELGPTDANAPVRLFDMERELRTKLANSPEAMKKGISALRERASAFNAQQTEVRAGSINSVWGLIDGGAGMRTVRNSRAWLELPEKDRHDILKTLESEAATRAGRQAAEASRDLSNLQRAEKLAFLRNGDQYLTTSDPQVLAKMSRGQVEAKRGVFGMEATQHLLAKWDELQKPGKVAEAKMDKQDFDMIADDLGLKPYARGQSETAKRALGTLQFRVEQLIDQKQRGEKRTLLREEKMDLMRKEMAHQVIIDGGLFSRERSVPVLMLDAEQVRDVVVPAADRAKIIEALKVGYKKNPANPAYAPTEDNIKRMFVRNVSPAEGLINAE